MKFFLRTALLLCIASPHNYAQFRQGFEVSGALYLKKGSVIVTPFVFHEKEQVLLVKDSLHFALYTAYHVDSFSYYDPELKWQRRYKRLVYQQREQFFEVVSPGVFEIVRVKQAFEAPESIIEHTLDRHRLDYSYFVWHDGVLSPLKLYKPKNLKEKYPQLWKEVHQYIREQNFVSYKLHHKMQIILKINDLFNEYQGSARQREPSPILTPALRLNP